MVFPPLLASSRCDDDVWMERVEKEKKKKKKLVYGMTTLLPPSLWRMVWRPRLASPSTGLEIEIDCCCCCEDAVRGVWVDVVVCCCCNNNSSDNSDDDGDSQIDPGRVLLLLLRRVYVWCREYIFIPWPTTTTAVSRPLYTRGGGTYNRPLYAKLLLQRTECGERGGGGGGDARRRRTE